jgi:small-conductance mechanosensitive channel
LRLFNFNIFKFLTRFTKSSVIRHLISLFWRDCLINLLAVNAKSVRRQALLTELVVSRLLLVRVLLLVVIIICLAYFGARFLVLQILSSRRHWTFFNLRLYALHFLVSNCLNLSCSLFFLLRFLKLLESFGRGCCFDRRRVFLYS